MRGITPLDLAREADERACEKFLAPLELDEPSRFRFGGDRTPTVASLRTEYGDDVLMCEHFPYVQPLLVAPGRDLPAASGA